MSILSPFRYALSEIRANFDDHWWWRSRLTQRVIRPVHALFDSAEAIDVMAEDWDTLIVLDACRADLFSEVADLSRYDEYQNVRSAGSMTEEWVHRNFTGRKFGDTVYISANPFVCREAKDSFHRIVGVWRDEFDEEKRTILPERVASAAIRTAEEYPNKRLIIHFMQPHHPFLTREDYLDVTEWDISAITGDQSPDHPHGPFEAIATGDANREDVWAAYAANMERVLDVALDLTGDLDGRTVITSDHGNLLGERTWPIPLRLYGHPAGIRHPALRTVPWAVLMSDGPRRTITDEGVNPADPLTTENVTHRLRYLGYTE